MGRYDWYQYYPPSRPIETDEGIKARSKRGEFVENWWAGRWITALERLMDKGRLGRGRRYARKGQVLSIEESKGRIEARVQGSRPRPYKVSIALPHLSDRQWEQVIEVMAEQALFTAQLLAGEMPQEIETVFQEAGVSLFPDRRRDLKTDCSCPDSSNPCKHIAAVHYILGEQFDEDPFLLFRMRGRSQEQIMAALRAGNVAEEALSEAEWDEESIELKAPLPEELDYFWELGQPLHSIKIKVREPLTEFPILKRLGQPRFLAEDIFALLGPAYQAISEQAISTVFTDEAEG